MDDVCVPTAVEFQCAPERAAPGDRDVLSRGDRTRRFQCAPERAAPGDPEAVEALNGVKPCFNALLNAQPPGTNDVLPIFEDFGDWCFNALLNAQPPGTFRVRHGRVEALAVVSMRS